MKRSRLFGFLLGLFLFGAMAAPGYAQQAPGDLLYGTQDHSYSVIFRGNGEALVFGRIEVPNAGAEPMTEVRLHVDNAASVQDLAAYQEAFRNDPRPATYVMNGDEFTFTLPTPVAPSQQTILVLAYRTTADVSERLGLYSFAFKTPTSPISWMSSVRVSASAEREYHMRNVESETAYRETYLDNGDDVTGSTALSESVSRISRNAVDRGQIYKYEENLAPGDSLEITGSYSKSKARLYLPHILVTLLILALIGVLGFTQRTRIHTWMKSKKSASEDAGMKSWITGGAVGMGFIGAVLVAAATSTTRWFIEEMDIRGDFAETLFPVVLLLGCVTVAALPSVLYSQGRGWRAGVAAFVFQLLWLIVAIIILGMGGPNMPYIGY